MKSLEQLINVEKGALLHQLFPREIPALLAFIQDMCATIREGEEMNRKNWDIGLMSFDYWLSLLRQAERSITRYGTKMKSSHRLFADQLFNGTTAAFTIHCITVYTGIRQHPNHKFTLAVDLLFNP